MAKVTTRKKAHHGGSGMVNGKIVRLAFITAIVAVAAILAFLRNSPSEGYGAKDTIESENRRQTIIPIAGQTPKNSVEEGGKDVLQAGDASEKGANDAGVHSMAARRAATLIPERTQSIEEDAPSPLAANEEPKLFDNAVENTIAVVSEPDSEFILPPPGCELEDDEIIEILRRPVVIDDDDDEETVATKERTAEFKTMALKAMEEEGLTFNQFVRDIVAVRREQAAMKEDALNELTKIYDREGEEAAREYLSQVNEDLRAQGMKEIPYPKFALEQGRR